MKYRSKNHLWYPRIVIRSYKLRITALLIFFCMFFMRCNPPLPSFDQLQLFECPESITYREALRNDLNTYTDDVILHGYKPFYNTDYIFQFDNKGTGFINTCILINKKYNSFHMDSISSLLLENDCKMLDFDTLKSYFFSFKLINNNDCEFDCHLSIGDSTLLTCICRFEDF